EDDPAMTYAPDEIVLNTRFVWSVRDYCVGEEYDLESVLLHELGHLEGLGHTPPGELAIMAPTIAPCEQRRGRPRPPPPPPPRRPASWPSWRRRSRRPSNGGSARDRAPALPPPTPIRSCGCSSRVGMSRTSFTRRRT